MGYDNDGIADDPRIRQQQDAGEDAQRVEEAHERESCRTEKGCRDDERETEREEIARKVLDALPADVIGEIIEERHESLITQWSGELPDPDSFSRYPEYAQRAMVDWNNARTIDESNRLDKIVDASTKGAAREQWLTFVLNLSFAAMTLIAFVITGDVVSFGFMAVPAISIFVNVKRRKRDDEDGQ